MAARKSSQSPLDLGAWALPAAALGVALALFGRALVARPHGLFAREPLAPLTASDPIPAACSMPVVDSAEVPSGHGSDRSPNGPRRPGRLPLAYGPPTFAAYHQVYGLWNFPSARSGFPPQAARAPALDQERARHVLRRDREYYMITEDHDASCDVIAVARRRPPWLRTSGLAEAASWPFERAWNLLRLTTLALAAAAAGASLWHIHRLVADRGLRPATLGDDGEIIFDDDSTSCLPPDGAFAAGPIFARPRASNDATSYRTVERRSPAAIDRQSARATLTRAFIFAALAATVLATWLLVYA